MNLSEFKQNAKRAMDSAAAKKPVLLHCGAVTFATVLVNLLGWLLALVAPEGGIGNLDTHSLLTTVQIVLTFAVVILLPFWDTGLSHATFCIYRGETPEPSSLLEGFRRWGWVTTSSLFRWLQYLLPIIPCGYTCYNLYLSASDLSQLYPEMPQELVSMTLVSYGLVYVLALVPLLALMMYRYRMVPWLLTKDDAEGGLPALRMSIVKLKGHKRQLLMLDLSYWWFHVADKVLLVLSLSGIVLDWLSISSISTGVQWLVPMAAGFLRLLLHWLAKPEILCVYCVFFQNLPQRAPRATQQPPAPGKMPWKY